MKKILKNITSIKTTGNWGDLDIDDDTGIGVMLAKGNDAKVILYTNNDSTVLDTLYFDTGKKFVYDAESNVFTFEDMNKILRKILVCLTFIPFIIHYEISLYKVKKWR